MRQLAFGFAPPICHIHANLVEIDNNGVLIFGAPGMGKSRLSWGLLKRQHSLVSDDLVKLSISPGNQLVGSRPQNTAHKIALRNVGIIPISSFFMNNKVILHSTIKIGVELIEFDPKNVTKCKLGSWTLTYRRFCGISIKIYQVPSMIHDTLPCLLERVIQDENSSCTY